MNSTCGLRNGHDCAEVTVIKHSCCACMCNRIFVLTLYRLDFSDALLSMTFLFCYFFFSFNSIRIVVCFLFFNSNSFRCCCRCSSYHILIFCEVYVRAFYLFSSSSSSLRRRFFETMFRIHILIHRFTHTLHFGAFFSCLSLSIHSLIRMLLQILNNFIGKHCTIVPRVPFCRRYFSQ